MSEQIGDNVTKYAYDYMSFGGIDYDREPTDDGMEVMIVDSDPSNRWVNFQVNGGETVDLTYRDALILRDMLNRLEA